MVNSCRLESAEIRSHPIFSIPQTNVDQRGPDAGSVDADAPGGGDGPPDPPAESQRWGSIVIGWSLVLTAAIVLWLRWRGADQSALIALVGLTPALIAPIAVAGLAAWRSRNTILQLATAALALTFVVTMNPVSAVIGCGPNPVASPGDETGDGGITIYSANVLRGGGQPDRIADAIVAAEADIIVLQEVSSAFIQTLRADPQLDDYAYRADGGGEQSGRVLWSRWPLSDVQVDWFVVSELVSATVDSPTGRFRLANVHTQAPIRNRDVAPWQAQFDQLDQLPTDVPTVLAGDFNATADHRPFRDLLGQGWTDVHEPKGCGFDATWPVDQLTPVPVYRLDHVLVTDHFEVDEVRLGRPEGSDHLPVITRIELRPELQSRAAGPGTP